MACVLIVKMCNKVSPLSLPFVTFFSRRFPLRGRSLEAAEHAMEDILLIDDDVELCSMLTDYLGRYEFRVHSVHRGDEGLKTAHGRDWALILLDVMLPGLDGFEVLKQIRASSNVSVMLLTAARRGHRRIVGLEIGADDYCPSRSTLGNCWRACAHPAPHSGATKPSRHCCASTIWNSDAAARSVMQGGKKIDLTSVEFALLET